MLDVLECHRSSIPGDNPGKMSDLPATTSEKILEVANKSPIDMVPEGHKVGSKDMVNQVGEGAPRYIPTQLDACVPAFEQGLT